MKSALRYLLFAAAATVGILLFLLAAASENAQLFEDYYSWIFGANLAVGSALFLLVCFLLARLYSRYRRGRFGSKLMTRLVLLFTVMGIVPGIIIYMVSVQFVSRSIESWFNIEVESALESGVKLGRGALEASLTDLRSRARRVASELSDMSDATLETQLAKIAEREQLQEVLVVSESGQLIATAGGKLTRLAPDLPTQAMIKRAKTFDGFGVIEGGSTTGPAGSSDLRLRVVVVILGDGSLMSLRSGMRYLQVLQPVPAPLAMNAVALRDAYSGYQERALAREGLRRFYLITLTLVLLLAVFAAMVSAFLLATDLAQPLLLLAEGTKAVAEGNLSPRPILATSDELGTLTQSFNTMTMQLADARAAVERNRQALEEAKAYLESVLANMSAGVMVLDDQLRLVTFNASASRILHHDLMPFQGLAFASISSVSAFSQPVIEAFSNQNAQAAGENAEATTPYWQQQIEIPRGMMKDDSAGDITLLARGGRLPLGNGSGYVVVFDDISDLISGQRSIAWAEVAQRLAHEIKNPLTPIQLSAERLMMKLQPKLAPSDGALLERGTNTIVNQVLAMQQMVDNFRDYAKTPPPQLQPLNLNELIEEILELYPDSKDGRVIHAQLSADLPKVLGDATQLRQVVHNLLQNAQDAVADGHANVPRDVRIDVTTETVHYAEAEGSTRSAVRLTVADNGPGFDARMLARAFEPYATSKRRGTGLGLPVVKKIIEEHGGRIELQNRKEASGARVLILLLKLAGSNV